jgi:hypothetical protein
VLAAIQAMIHTGVSAFGVWGEFLFELGIGTSRSNKGWVEGEDPGLIS